MTPCRLLASSAIALVLLVGATVRAQDPAPQRPTFKSAVDLVTVAAVARDRHGRFVRDLKKDDFVVSENGVPRPLVDFHADDNAAVRVALLFDVSGSMRVSSNIEQAKQAARYVLGALRMGSPADDVAAVNSFDIELQSLQSFTADPGAIENALSRVVPYGQTSLYDAIAQTARAVANTQPGDRHRRAVIVLTDGVDTSSEMKPEQVSAIASAIDVPVYVIAVVSPLDHQGTPGAVESTLVPAQESVLRTVARWTGGDLFVASAPAHASVAARQIVDELRHQYVLAFAASSAAGWHAVVVKVKQKDIIVRARSGYLAGAHVGT